MRVSVINMDAGLKSQFLSLYCMVLADGVIDARELEVLYKIGVEQYGLNQEEITATVRDAGSSFVVPTLFNDKIKFLFNLAQIACADGEIDPLETDLMKRYIIKMGFEEENSDGISKFLFDSAMDGKSFEEVLAMIKQ